MNDYISGLRDITSSINRLGNADTSKNVEHNVSKSLIGVNYESNFDPGDSSPGNNCGRVEPDPGARRWLSERWVIGGVAGHYAGHHGLLGAGAGCVIGHHEAKKHAREHAAQQSVSGGSHEGSGGSAPDK